MARTPESGSPQAEASSVERYDQEIEEIEARMQERIRERDADFNTKPSEEKVALGRTGEAKWRGEADKPGDRIRNERGHYSSMDAEQARALIDNELFDENKKYDGMIQDLERTLAMLRELRQREIERQEEDDTAGNSSDSEDSAESDPVTSDTETDASDSSTESDGASGAESTDSSAEADGDDTAESASGSSPDTDTSTDAAESAESAVDSPASYESTPPRSPEYAPTAYTPSNPLYAPGYTPEPPTYTPTPEVARDMRGEFLRLVNGIARQDQERAIERYGGFRPFGALSGFLRLIRLRGSAELVENVDQRISESPLGRTIGRVKSWFDKVGQRNVMEDEQLTDMDRLAENMEEAGRFTRRPWWKRALKIGGKILGGFGVAGATIMTGGVGAATSLLWAGGLKEGYDGVLQGIEQLGWGNRRGALELRRQNEMQGRIDALRQRLTNNPNMLPSEFAAAVNEIQTTERQLVEQEANNIRGERTGQLVRSLTSSVLTIGTGLLGGVPMGRINYDNDNTKMAEAFRHLRGTPDQGIMNETHRGFWNAINGPQFGYEHNSIAEAIRDTVNGATASGTGEHGYIVNTVIKELKSKVGGDWPLTALSPYGQTAHQLANGFAAADWLRIAAPAPYLLGEALRHGAHRRNDELENYQNIGRTPEPDHGGYSPYEASRNEHSNASESYGGGASLARGSEPAAIEPFTGQLPTTPEAGVEREHSTIDDYLGAVPPSYRREVSRLAEAAPAMDNECRLSVCVPVAYSEHRIIRSYLDSFLAQTDSSGNPINPNLYEVNIFVNGPQTSEDEIQQTVGEIERFKAEHPEIHVNVLSESYAERQPMGFLRKLVTDFSLLRSRRREVQSGELYLVSHDADIRIADPMYLSKIIERLDQDRGTQMLSGEVDYSDEDKKKYPIIWTARRLWQFIDTIRTGSNTANMTRKAVGANSIIRASSYADVKGFRFSDRVAEDLALGEKINSRYGRKSPDGNNVIANFPYRTIISARRDIQSIENGKPIVQGYDNFESNDEVRGDIPESNAPAEITPDNEPLFLAHLGKEASSQFNSLFAILYWNNFDKDPAIIEERRQTGSISDETRRRFFANNYREIMDQTTAIFNKASGFLGIETEIRPSRPGAMTGEVKVTNWDKLKQGLEAKTPE